jgi:hypothetical protein
MRDRSREVSDVLAGIEDGGLPGLTKTVYRMIGPNQPSAECVRQADDDFASAATPDDVWDAALDFAACLRDAKMDPEPPEPPHPPDPPPPPPPPPHPPKDSVADVVLAALLAHLHGQGERRPVQQHPTSKSAE